MIERPKTRSMLFAAGSANSVTPFVSQIPLNTREPHNALALRLIREFRGNKKAIPFHPDVPSSEEILEIIRFQIRESSPHTMVLCSEVFSTFADVSIELVEWLKHSFPASNVRIVCTLRRIDDYLCSWHGQRLRFGHEVKPLRKTGIRRFQGSVHFNYRKLLKAWLKVFPDAEFAIRNYSDVLANGGSIPDFITQSGLNFPPNLPVEKNINTSIPRCFYELCRVANFELEPVMARSLREQIETLAPSLAYPENKRVELFGQANRQLIYERFEPFHAFLNRRTGYTVFFPDQEEVLLTREIPEKSASMDAARLLLPLLNSSIGTREIIDFVGDFEQGTYWDKEATVNSP